MQNILAEQNDFLLDLGDAFSLDDARETAATVGQKYLNQLAVFDLAAHSVPVFLVLGNHERETGWNLDDFGADVGNSLPVLNANARKRYFLNPEPDDFYSGNTDVSGGASFVSGDHLRGDYYAFEWGDALFVAIEPFWYTMRKPYPGTIGWDKDDEVVGTRWDWTLGQQQYLWLRQTLQASSATYKFVFAHHVAGGIDDYGRGGARGAKYCEWGGYDIDGTTWGFDTNRPGWAMPVHQLLARNHVTIFFHADHTCSPRRPWTASSTRRCRWPRTPTTAPVFRPTRPTMPAREIIRELRPPAGHGRAGERHRRLRAVLSPGGGDQRIDRDELHDPGDRLPGSRTVR